MNSLKYLKEFESVLRNYRVSDEAIEVLKQTKLVLCDAATASGRNTVIRELLKSDEYYFIVSDTTRKPRVNDGVLEENGVAYWFRSEREMLEDLRSGKLVEAEVIHKQQVSGMSIREIKKAQDNGKIAITDIDRIGVAHVKAAKPDAICLFFIPPNYEIWQKRLFLRGTMENEEYKRRMETARLEYENALSKDFYMFVINDRLEDTVSTVNNIVHGKIDMQYQAKARAIAENISQKLAETTHK